MADYNSSNEWNFTAANNYSQLEDQTRCFSYIVYRKSAIEDFYITYVVSIIFNSICAVPACLLNLLVIIAVWKKQQLHTPSNVLLSNLALTDFGVGCIVQPLFVAHKIGAIQGNISLHCIASLASKTLASVLGVVSLTTLTAISIDRLLALILNVRYRIVVTLRFTARTVGVLWIISIILTLPLFIYPLSFVYCMVLLGAICFAVTTFAYAKLLRLIQRQRCRVQTDLHAAQNNQATSQTQMQHPTEMINIAKYRSSTHTVIYLVLFMIIFYSPYLISNIVLAVTRTSDDRFKAAFNITHTILFMNSLLNPVFHCWRIRNIRKAICEMFSDIMPE
ncbi:melanocyte-stimulating hormone receptor-like [Porites lutea]|uniref:melanocyte-stimulating hormone receptor-like n=1 Tax=Porites lutea TaxID=51062 RepID=UPI003CC56D92